MTDTEIIRKKHIDSFKVLIDSFRAKANLFVSVMEVRLNYLLDESKVSTVYRHEILEYLKNNGYLNVQGERKMMRYKFIEPLIKIDSEALATKAYEVLSAAPKKKKKQYRFVHQAIKDEPIIVEPVTMTQAKEFALKDKVVFMRNNQIVQGEIVSQQFGYKEAESENETKDLVLDYDTVIFDLVITNYIPERGTIIKDLEKSEIFSNIDLLFHSHAMKFQHSLKLVKTK
jgi:hypothetical protein